MLELKDFEAAYNKVQEVVLPTKLIKSDYFSDQTGNDVYLKPENMQLTGAYKIRGAYYKISTLSEEEKAKGLITASAGNHAQGVALAAARQGVKATIVMPTTTPLLKVNRTKDLGAEVILHGDVYDEACAHALDLAAEHGYTFVHPFDDPTVATGQGTIAMDIFKELPTVDYILVPIGGGGLDTLAESPMDLQKEVFLAQANLAEETHKPLIIHCVKAWADLIACKKAVKPEMPWIIHGFRGNGELASQLVRLGFYLSFGDRFNPSALRAAWPDFLFLETDDKSIDIRGVYQNVAEALDIPEEKLRIQIAKNVSIFHLNG